jgi:signal transduction histidine kinase
MKELDSELTLTNKYDIKGRTISRDLTISHVLVVVVVSTLIISLNYWRVSRKSAAQLEQKADEHISYLLASLEIPIWNFNKEVVRKIGQTYIDNELVAVLRITDDRDHTIFESVKDNEKDLIERAREVIHNGKVIGHIDIGLTTRLYKESNRQLLRANLLTLLIFILALSGVTGLLVRVSLRSSLNDLIHGIEQIARGDYEYRFVEAKQREIETIISRFKYMGEQVKGREEEILKKSKELEAFVYTVSHDLKSPLVSLQGFVDALIEENKGRFSKDSEHITERIIANVSNMEEIIYDLLEISRIGRISAKPVKIEVKKLFEELAWIFEARLKEKNIKLNFKAKEDCAIHADKNQMIKVMDNLMTNAIKFTGDTNNPKIELICHYNNKSWVQICVKDNGTGIDPSYHEKIFELFQRLDAGRHVEGTGVGLTLVKRTVEDFGGRVWVESELGKGSEFWIELPR